MDDGDRRSKVQRLYDACDAVFSPGKGGLPTLSQIRWPRGILGTYVAPASRLGSLESVDVITDQCL